MCVQYIGAISISAIVSLSKTGDYDIDIQCLTLVACLSLRYLIMVYTLKNISTYFYWSFQGYRLAY
jgi:hypothetical protein